MCTNSFDFLHLLCTGGLLTKNCVLSKFSILGSKHICILSWPCVRDGAGGKQHYLTTGSAYRMVHTMPTVEYFRELEREREREREGGCPGLFV